MLLEAGAVPRLSYLDALGTGIFRHAPGVYQVGGTGAECAGEPSCVSDQIHAAQKWVVFSWIVEILPGLDGLVHSMKVSTSKVIIAHPITKACVLEKASG